MLRSKHETGITLVELMITIVISAVVVLACIQLYLTVISTSKATHDRNRLNGELRTLMNLMTKDIRRAGFWNADMGTDDLWVNPFTAAATDIRVGSVTGETANGCIQYSYDLNLNGAVDPNEYTSVRLKSEAVQIANVQLADCDAGASSDWVTATTDELTISDLVFTLNETCLDVETEVEEACPCDSGGACQTIRSIDILLGGQLTADSSVTETMRESVKVRNDKFECGTSCP